MRGQTKGMAGFALGLAIWLAGAGSAAIAAPAPVIDYLITPAGAAADPVVKVEFSFTDPAARTRVRLPDWFASETGLWRNISDIHADGATVSHTGDSLLVLSHAPGAKVRLSYLVHSGRPPGPPLTSFDYRPEVTTSGFVLLGEAALAYPEMGSDPLASLRFGQAPPGWNLYADADPSAGPLPLAKVRESVMIGGPDVRLKTRDIGGGAVLRIAIRGAFAFSDDQFADRLAAILSAERAYWRDDSRDPYFVSLDSTYLGGHLFLEAGIGRAGGASFTASSNSPLGEFAYVMAHEPLHRWIARQIGGLPPVEHEPEGYWFSEGFTDFIALRTLLRIGVLTPEQFTDQVWDRTGNARVMPNAALAKAYWTDPSLFQVPYGDGLLLALFWDAKLRAATQGRLNLDDVLRAQLGEANSHPGGPTADRLFPVIYQRLSGVDLTADVARYVTAGEAPTLPPDIYPGCWMPAAPFDPDSGQDPPHRLPVKIGSQTFAIDHLNTAPTAACAKLLSGESNHPIGAATIGH